MSDRQFWAVWLTLEMLAWFWILMVGITYSTPERTVGAVVATCVLGLLSHGLLERDALDWSRSGPISYLAKLLMPGTILFVFWSFVFLPMGSYGSVRDGTWFINGVSRGDLFDFAVPFLNDCVYIKNPRVKNHHLSAITKDDSVVSGVMNMELGIESADASFINRLREAGGDYNARVRDDMIETVEKEWAGLASQLTLRHMRQIRSFAVAPEHPSQLGIKWVGTVTVVDMLSEEK